MSVPASEIGMIRQLSPAGERFLSWRCGMLVHWGVSSVYGLGEAELGRRELAVDQLKKLARKFKPDKFDAGKICTLARKCGMKYIIFPAVRQDGFRMYDSALHDFNAVNFCGRDFMYEMMTAARRTGLKFGIDYWCSGCDEMLADSLNELLGRYPDIELLWYDQTCAGDCEAAEKLNSILRRINPQLVFNDRNGGRGDFSTWTGAECFTANDQPFELLISLNEHRGYFKSDHEWKTPKQLIRKLLYAVSRGGNLLVNTALDERGKVPEAGEKLLHAAGSWLNSEGKALIACRNIEAVDPPCSDSGGKLFASGKNFWYVDFFDTGKVLKISGITSDVDKVRWQGKKLDFRQNGQLLEVRLPRNFRDVMMPVINISCK